MVLFIILKESYNHIIEALNRISFIELIYYFVRDYFPGRPFITWSFFKFYPPHVLFSGYNGRITPGRGVWVKSKSELRFPSIATFSRTVGR